MHTFYDADLGFYCARWLQDHDLHKPLKDEFCAYVGEGKEFESLYISLIDNPGRAFKFSQYCLDPYIFIIDAVKLQQINIHIKPTIVLAKRWRIKYKGSDRLYYVTGSHWLVRF